MPTSTLNMKRLAPRRWLLRNERGWIGVDIGAALTKMAQLERAGDTYRIVARWVLPSHTCAVPSPTSETSDSTSGLTQQLRQARGTFRGRRVAATLSTSVTPHRCLELPPGSIDEVCRMAHQEVNAECGPGDERCVDCWPIVSPAGGGRSTAHLSVMEVERERSVQLSHDMRRAGLDCRVLDGLPCVLARAVQLASPRQCEKPTAILDIGHSATVFVVAENGYPQFTRVLRGCGLESFVSSIQNRLQLTAAESTQVIRRTGLPPHECGEPIDASHQVVYQLLAEPVAVLFAEIARTLTYLRRSLPALVPECFVVCGGGSFVPNLNAHLAAETGLSVDAWSLSTTGVPLAGQDDSLFAAAAALSALAWER